MKPLAKKTFVGPPFCYYTFSKNVLTKIYDANTSNYTSLLSFIVNKFQPDATVCRYLFTAKSLYMFRVSQYPSSGALKTVTAASGAGHNTGTATYFQRGLIRLRWRKVA